jgi:hypothetical protein
MKDVYTWTCNYVPFNKTDTIVYEALGILYYFIKGRIFVCYFVLLTIATILLKVRRKMRRKKHDAHCPEKKRKGGKENVVKIIEKKKPGV